MKIAIDLDHTISANNNSIEFFSILTRLLIPENYIFILTNRDTGSMQETVQYLKDLGIEYNKCVTEYADAVYRFILKNIRDEDRAQDVVQESFTRMWERVENNHIVMVDKDKKVCIKPIETVN